MPIQYSRDDPEETLIHMTYPTHWKWNELYSVQREVNALLDSSTAPVVLLQDFSRNRSLPPNAISHVKNLVLRIHPTIKVMVFVGMNPFFRTMWEVFSALRLDQLVSVRFLFAESVEQGIVLGLRSLAEASQPPSK